MTSCGTSENKKNIFKNKFIRLLLDANAFSFFGEGETFQGR